MFFALWLFLDDLGHMTVTHISQQAVYLSIIKYVSLLRTACFSSLVRAMVLHGHEMISAEAETKELPDPHCTRTRIFLYENVLVRTSTLKHPKLKFQFSENIYLSYKV